MFPLQSSKDREHVAAGRARGDLLVRCSVVNSWLQPQMVTRLPPCAATATGSIKQRAVLFYMSLSPPPALSDFLFLRPGRPAPNGEVAENSITFSLSTRTMNEGTLTIFLPTRM